LPELFITILQALLGPVEFFNNFSPGSNVVGNPFQIKIVTQFAISSQSRDPIQKLSCYMILIGLENSI